MYRPACSKVGGAGGWGEYRGYTGNIILRLCRVIWGLGFTASLLLFSRSLTPEPDISFGDWEHWAQGEELGEQNDQIELLPKFNNNGQSNVNESGKCNGQYVAIYDSVFSSTSVCAASCRHQSQVVDDNLDPGSSVASNP